MYYDQYFNPIVHPMPLSCRTVPAHCTAFSLGNLLNDFEVIIIERYHFEKVDRELIDKLNNSFINLILVVDDHNRFSDITNIILQITNPCIELTWTPNHTYKSIFYPYWIVNYPKAYYIKEPSISDSNFKKYLYSCLNYNIRLNRIANLVKFHQSSYWNKSFITFTDKEPSDKEKFAGTNNFISTDDYLYFINYLKPLLPISMSGSSTDLLDYNNPAFLDTYVNIAVETFTESEFITEKSLKPILAEQMFVILGCKNNVKILKDLGLDIYDDIIDHDRYQIYDKFYDRLIGLHQLLNEMQHWDWQTIYQQTQIRRKNNRLVLNNLQTAYQKDLLRI
jgi:hypothetical protein